MYPKVFKIQNNNLTVAFKGYVLKYQGQSKIKLWCEGVHKTYGEAERQAKKMIKTLSQK